MKNSIKNLKLARTHLIEEIQAAEAVAKAALEGETELAADLYNLLQYRPDAAHNYTGESAVRFAAPQPYPTPPSSDDGRSKKSSGSRTTTSSSDKSKKSDGSYTKTKTINGKRYEVTFDKKGRPVGYRPCS